MKSYNFGEFMRGQHEVKRPKGFKLNSFIPAPTISTLFFNEPCLILLGAGAVIVGTIVLENHLAKGGREQEAERLAMFMSLGLPMVAFGGCIYFILRVGKMFL